MKKQLNTYPLRLPASLKAAVAEISKADGTSINQFVATAVADAGRYGVASELERVGHGARDGRVIGYMRRVSSATRCGTSSLRSESAVSVPPVKLASASAVIRSSRSGVLQQRVQHEGARAPLRVEPGDERPQPALSSCRRSRTTDRNGSTRFPPAPL